MADQKAQTPADPSPYIRTYAKDVTALTGKPPEELKPRVLAPAKPTRPWLADEKKRTTTENGVEVEEQSPIGAEKKENSPSDADLAREAVLERLRSQRKPEEIGPVEKEKAPVPPPPPPKPKPLKPPKPPKPEKPPRKSDLASPLHTFKTDFSERVDRKKASVFSVLAAESDERTKTRPARSPARPGQLLPVLLGAIFIIAGGTGVYFAYRFATGGPTVPILPTVPSLIFADERRELSGTGPELVDALASAGGGLSDGDVLVAYTTETVETENGPVRSPRSGGALIEAMNLPAPGILFRNTAPESTVGVVRAGGEARAFFILRVTSYERTFAGLLEWEPTMASDLAVLYPPHPLALLETESATSTATTSPGFSDEVVANHDARVLYDARGNMVLLYGYRDKETLIIARDRAAFAELLERLSNSQTR